jgi:GT2 family glycosyltransferase
MIKLSIIIPVFNKLNFTKSCLNDLFHLPEDTYEIIIVDNASEDETEKYCSEIVRRNFIYLRNERNLFHSKACNIGYTFAKGKNILFINNDIKVKSNHNNWTDELIKNCQDAIVSPTMGLLDNKLNFVKEANNELKGNSYLSGWFLASSKENWEKLNSGNGEIFDERYPFYWNDTNLSFSAREKDILLKVLPVPIVHFGKISASQLNINKLYNEGRQVFLKDWEKLIK